MLSEPEDSESRVTTPGPLHNVNPQVDNTPSGYPQATSAVRLAIDFGWHLVRAADGTKHPLETGWSVNGECQPVGLEPEELFDDGRYCVLTGPVSGIFDVETDTDEEGNPEGELNLKTWCHLSGVKLPPGPRMVTRSGSIHRIFRFPDSGRRVLTRSGVLKKVDVRGNGGQFLAWGDGRTWHDLDLPIPEAPPELVELVQRESTTASSNGSTSGAPDPVPDVIPHGERDKQLFREGVRLRRSGMRKADALIVFKAKWEGCKDARDKYGNPDHYPWSKAERDFERAWANNKPEWDEGELATIVAGLTHLADTSESGDPGGETAPERVSRLVAAKARQNRPKKVWAVEGVIPEWGVGQIYGETYTGKTFVTLDLGLTVANELDNWLGHKVNKTGPVIFALMEGAFDFQDRIDAWLSAHPGATDDNLWTLEEEPLDLRDAASIDILVGDIELLELKPAMVVIDTQSLATPGTDENSNTEMNLVFANLKRLAVRLRCPVFTVHHTGHDATRARGASSQRAALDVEIRVEVGIIQATKVKAGKPSAELPFTIVAAGDSAYIRSANDPKAAMWAAITVSGGNGMTVRDLGVIAFGAFDGRVKKQVQRAVNHWIDTEVIVPVAGSTPPRYRVVTIG